MNLLKVMAVVQLIWLVMGSPVPDDERIPDYDYPVYAVDECPRNVSQWDLASDRRNCSKTSSTRLRYHCMPDRRMKRLVEFCYPNSRIKMVAGYCIVLFDGGAISKSGSTNCSRFVNDSCPEDFYDSDQMYMYPGCLLINSMNSCYKYDTSCPPDVESTISTPESKTMDTSTTGGETLGDSNSSTVASDDNGHVNIAVPIVTGLIAALIIIVLFLTYRYKRDRILQLWNDFRGSQLETDPEENIGLMPTVQLWNDFRGSQHETDPEENIGLMPTGDENERENNQKGGENERENNQKGDENERENNQKGDENERENNQKGDENERENNQKGDENERENNQKGDENERENNQKGDENERENNQKGDENERENNQKGDENERENNQKGDENERENNQKGDENERENNQKGDENERENNQKGDENEGENNQKGFLEEWQSDDMLYYDGISAVQDLEERLLKDNIIMVIGGPGLGKTSLIRHVALKWHKEARKEMDKELESWKVFVVSSFEELNNVYTSHENSKDLQIYVFDDPIGIHALNKQKLSQLFGLYNDEILFRKKQTTKKLIMTCRRIVYKEAKQSMPKIDSFILDIESKQNRLTAENRKQIFQKHCKDRDFHSIKSCFNEYYPLLCRLYANRQEQNIVQFFSRPFHCLQVEFENMKQQNPPLYSALVFCMLNKGEISSERCQPSGIVTDMNYIGYECSLNDIYEELETAVGTYLKKSELKFRFIHEYMWEILAIHFGSFCPEVILEKMDSNFIMKYVKIKDMEIPGRKDAGSQECILLPPNKNHMELLSKRMFEDINQFHLGVFEHSCWREQSFKREFMAYLNSMPYEDICKTFLDAQGVPENGQNITKSVHQELLWNKTYKLGSEFSCDIRPLRWIVANVLTFLLEYFVSLVKEHNDDTSRIFGQDEEQTLLLVLACFSGDLDVVKCVFLNIHKENINNSCILQNVEGNLNPHREFMPLAAACHANSPTIVQFLIEQKANVHISDDTCKSSLLYQSLSLQKYQVCLLLIEGGANLNIKDEKKRTLLHIAASKGEGAVSVMESLIRKGIDVDEKDAEGKTPIFHAFESEIGPFLKAKPDNAVVNDLEYFKSTTALLKRGAKPYLWDIHRKSPVYALFERARKSPNILQILVENGLDVNFVDENEASLLHFAVLSENKNHVECVLRAQTPVEVNHQDKTIRSALYKAAEKGAVDIAELLIDHEADVNMPDKKKLTPLYQAVDRGLLQMVKVLVENGAMVNEKYEKKNNATPLHIAAKKGHFEISEYLLQKGARPSMVDDGGRSPQDVASDEGHYLVRDLLLRSAVS